jgi:hypothetical protein
MMAVPPWYFPGGTAGDREMFYSLTEASPLWDMRQASSDTTIIMSRLQLDGMAQRSADGAAC